MERPDNGGQRCLLYHDNFIERQAQEHIIEKAKQDMGHQTRLLGGSDSKLKYEKPAKTVKKGHTRCGHGKVGKSEFACSIMSGSLSYGQVEWMEAVRSEAKEVHRASGACLRFGVDPKAGDLNGLNRRVT